MNRIVNFSIVSLIFFLLLRYLFSNVFYFIRPFDPVFFGNLYSQSQYVLGPRSIGGIGDDGLYAFAGYYYFFQKGDVSAVNFEHPPLGKYLIGLSILLFNNENVINIIYFLLILALTYKLGILLTHNKTLSFMSVFLLSIDPLFLDHLLRSQLDLPFSLFFLGAFYAYLRSFKKQHFIFLSFFLWGCAFSTRFFPFFIPIWFLMLLRYFVSFRKRFNNFIIASSLVPAVYIIAHISFFYYHPSLIEFLRHKKWMVAWFQGSVILQGNILRNIFTGSYIDPSGKAALNNHWSLMQPVVFVFSLIPHRFLMHKKISQEWSASYLLCLLYIGYVIFLTDGAAKFLMPIYPVLTVLSIRTLYLVYCIIVRWKKQISLS